MHVAIRVDASTVIGLGHLKRCLSLADALCEEGGNVLFVTRRLDFDVASLVRSAGHRVASLPILPLPAPTTSEVSLDCPAHADWAGLAWSTDAQDTANALKSSRIDWLIVDHYAFDAQWHQLVFSRLNCRIAIIDDLADRKLCCDLLVDHNVHVDHVAKYSGKLVGTPEMLVGPQFALLAKAYRLAPRYQFSERVNRVGIFMGGTDLGNWTDLVLRACRKEVGFKGEIEVVLTSASPHCEHITALAASYGGTSVSVDLSNLASFFARNDLHVGAGGGSTWERCCIGAPAVGVICATNQLSSMPYLNDLGVIAMVGTPSRWRCVQSSDIAQVVARLIEHTAVRRNLSERSRALVDGMGARRVARRLFQIGGKKQ